MIDAQHIAQIARGRQTADPLAAMASASLSLGFFFAWTSLGWNHGSSAFGVSLRLEAPFHICLQAAIALTFVCLSFIGPRMRGRSNELFAAAGTGIALAGVLASWIGSATGSGVVSVLASILTGMAQALFMWAWLRCYRMGTNRTFAAMAAASGIDFSLYLFVLLFDGAPSRALSIALPLLALVIFAIAPRPTGGSAKQAAERGGEARTGRSPLPWTIGLLLCCLAGGIASFGETTDSEQATFLIALASFALSTVGIFLNPMRTAPIFIGLSLCVCICVAIAMAAPQSPKWVSGLTFAGFWLLEIYAFAWFAQRDEGRGLSPNASRYLAAIYALSAAANIVGLAVPTQVAYTAALVLTVAAFALTSFDVGRASAQRPTASAPHGIAKSGRPGDIAGALPTMADAFAQRFDLTEAEQGVFSYLARGYALKQLALELHISESTAKYHRRNVYQKCGVASRQELINLVDEMAAQNTFPQETSDAHPSA